MNVLRQQYREFSRAAIRAARTAVTGVQVEEHADKLANPEKYDTGWADKDERQREGLLKKWKKDLQRNAEQAEIEIEVWKERFGNES